VSEHDDRPAHGFEQAGTHDVTGTSPSLHTDSSLQHPTHRSPFVWVVWAATVGAAVLFVWAIVLLMLTGGTTTDVGWSEQRRGNEWFVADVNPAGPAADSVQAGDRLVALNGVPPFGAGGTSYARRELSVGESYRLALMRNGSEQQQALIVGEGPSAFASRVTYLLVAGIWCTVGLFIGLSRPDDGVARLAFFGAMTIGAGFAVQQVVSGLLPNPLHVFLGFHFFCRFPSGRPVRPVLRGVLIGGYAITFASLLVRYWMEFTFALQGASGPAGLVMAYPILSVMRNQVPLYMFNASLVGMVVMVARNYRGLANESERRRVRWLVYGSMVALLPNIVWSAMFFSGVARLASFATWGLATLVCTAGIPIAAAYAIVRHRVFDIKVVVRQGLQYLLARRALQIAVVLPALALAVTVFRQRHLTIVELVTETRTYLYFLGAAGLMLRFRRSIESWLDRRFFREEYDKEQLVIGLLEDMRKVESVSELTQLAGDTLSRALHLSRFYVWYVESNGLETGSAPPALRAPRGFPSAIEWLRWLEHRGVATPLSLTGDAGLSRQERQWFASTGIMMVVPMMDAGDRLVGALLLGSKRSEEPFTASEERLLDAIARQAALVREHLRLRARVSDDARVRHDVLARLDPELPDVLKECPSCGACFDGRIDRCEQDGQLLSLSLPVSRTIDQKYRLDRRIGKGGMGAVYEARDVRLDRSVAVKIMLSRAFGQQTALRRFRREARAAARLNHPNIVPVYDVGPLAGEAAYLVMELVRGVTLRVELDQRRVLTPGAAAEWFGPLLEGTAAAHAHGIVHRDLKPENVIGRREETGALTVKILDLGLVKFRAGEDLVTGTLTQEGHAMGTPAYMSPEQLLGREVDHRTDIYALAVMLVEALTGQRPFSAASYADLVSAAQTPYRLPSSSPPARALGDLLQRCLAPDPECRVSSAEALRSQLLPLLDECQPEDLLPPTSVSGGETASSTV